MASRIRWMILGASVGVWATTKVQAEFRARLDSVRPQNIAEKFEVETKRVVGSVRSAAKQGVNEAIQELERLRNIEAS